MQVRLVSETCTIMLVQAGMQANQFASTIDCAGNITNFTENRAGKSFFFSEDLKEICPIIFVSVIRKVNHELNKTFYYYYLHVRYM